MPVTVARRSLLAGGRLASCVADDPRLVLRLATWRVVLPVLKRTISVQTLARWMWRAQLPGGDRATRMLHVRSVVERGGRLLTSANCLERSLVLYRLFSEAGVPVSLVMGTRYVDGRLDGHVWVECSGVPYGEPHAAEYGRVVAFGDHGQPRSADTPTT